MRNLLAASILVASSSWYSEAASLTARAVEPTASGEIGVNEPHELGDSTHYVAHIGVDTQYLTLEGSTTRFHIGVNTEYLTRIETTMTVEDRPIITEIPVNMIAETAIEAGPELAAGDVTVLFSEEFRAALEGEVKAAAASCGAPGAKHRKRQDDFLGCVLRAGQGSIEQGGSTWEIVNPEIWNDFVLEVAQNAPARFMDILRWGGNRVRQNQMLVYSGMALAMGVGVEVAVENLKGPPKLKFSDGKVGDPEPTATATTANPSSTTSSGCDPAQTTVNADSPVCDDDDCKGKDGKCTTENKKDCRCSMYTLPLDTLEFDYEWGSEQQRVLAEYLDDSEDTPTPPDCFENTNGDGFDGKPRAEPSNWCVCNSAGSTGIYSTLTTGSPCALSTMPTKTISITKAPDPTGMTTSCKWTTATILGTQIDPYCTCNDNKMHGPPVEQTTTIGGETRHICVAPESKFDDMLPSVDNPTCHQVADAVDLSPDVKFANNDEVRDFVKKTCKRIADGEIEGRVDERAPIETIGGEGWINVFISNVYSDDACGETSDEKDIKNVPREDCERFLMSTVENCNSNDLKRGGWVTEACFSWSVVMVPPE